MAEDIAISPIIKTTYGKKDFFGERITLDLSTSLPANKPGGCAVLDNVIRRNRRSLAKRPGTAVTLAQEIKEASAFQSEIMFALHRHSFQRSDGARYGVGVENLVVAGGTKISVNKLVRSTLTIQVSSAGTTSAFFDLRVESDSGAWVATLYRNGAIVSGWPKNYDAGTVAGGTLDHILSELISDINASSGWTCSSNASNTSKTTVGALGSIFMQSLNQTGVGIKFTTIPYWNVIEADSKVYPGTEGNPGVDEEWTNCKPIDVDNTMLVPCGFAIPTLKYDGLYFCKPGLPQATLSAIADSSGGTTHASGNEYIYKLVFVRTDNRGNIIYGPYSDDTLAVASHTVGGSPKDIDVTFNTINRTSNIGFDPRSAIVNGLQSGVTTITVDNTNQLQIGDIVYFYDGVSSSYVTRTVTARTSTTIGISGAAVNVADNAVISNIRVEIHRTVSTGIDFFLVAEIPVDTINTTQVFVDSVTDANLGADTEEQLKPFEAPPKARFACVHQNVVVLAGLEDDPDGIRWNDPDWGSEAFPTATNRDTVRGGRVAGITGIVSESDNVLAVFKERSYFRVIGNLAENQYVIVDASEEQLGIVSHSSIVKTKDGIMGISLRGPVIIQEGKVNLEISSEIEPAFSNMVLASDLTPGDTLDDYSDRTIPVRSTGTYWQKERLVLFFLPYEIGTYATPSSTPRIKRYAEGGEFYCFDLETKEWRKWPIRNPAINAHLAMELFGDDLFFLSTNRWTLSTPQYQSANFLFRFLDPDSLASYVDDTYIIEEKIQLNPEYLGTPSTEKLMPSAKVYALHSDDALGDFALVLSEFRDNKKRVGVDESSLITKNFKSSPTGEHDLEKVFKPTLGKFRSNIVEFSSGSLYTCPVFSSFELSYKPVSMEEGKVARSDTKTAS